MPMYIGRPATGYQARATKRSMDLLFSLVHKKYRGQLQRQGYIRDSSVDRS